MLQNMTSGTRRVVWERAKAGIVLERDNFSRMCCLELLLGETPAIVLVEFRKECPRFGLSISRQRTRRSSRRRLSGRRYRLCCCCWCGWCRCSWGWCGWGWCSWGWCGWGRCSWRCDGPTGLQRGDLSLPKTKKSAPNNEPAEPEM